MYFRLIGLCRTYVFTVGLSKGKLVSYLIGLETASGAKHIIMRIRGNSRGMFDSLD